MHKISILLISLLFTAPAFSQNKNPPTTEAACNNCLTDSELNEIANQLEALIKSNKELIKKAKELEELQKAQPSMTLDPLVIAIDKDGRVFVKDQLQGKLNIGNLDYDVAMKLDTQVVKAKKEEYGFNLTFKAGVLQNYERQDDGSITSYTSGALVIEPFYYRHYNANLVVGPRLYGPALGVDLTEHFDALVGLGLLYNNDKTFFLGAAFDF